MSGTNNAEALGLVDTAKETLMGPINAFRDVQKTGETVTAYNSKDLGRVAIGGMIVGAVVENVWQPVQKVKQVIGL